MRKPAFTMIELIFVIVVLGILASIAVPRFAATRDDAIISKARAQVASIRSAIMTEHQRGILQGQTDLPRELDNSTVNIDNEALFDGNASNPLLSYALFSRQIQGRWFRVANTSADTIHNYDFYINGIVTERFEYNITSQLFDCDHNNANCRLLAE